MQSAANLMLSLLVIATLALAAGGIHLLVRGNNRKHGALMLIAAAVLFGNVLIWTLPL